MINNSGLSRWGRYIYDNDTLMYLTNRLSRIFPTPFNRLIQHKQKSLNLNSLTVIFSFDCDTLEDIDASCWIYEEFSKRNLKFTLSVPGEQLIEGQSQYRNLAEKGVPFMNHGYKSHAYKEGGRYFSKTFYREMSKEEIVYDIKKGHQTVIDITGQIPKGFRTPHFGTFCKSENLSFIHNILNQMDYQFSSSTIPFYGLLFGSNQKCGHLHEIPLSGNSSSPLTLFDSWSYVENPFLPTVTPYYVSSFIKTIETNIGQPGLLCFYADPSHIKLNKGYIEILDRIRSLNINTFYFEDLFPVTR